VTPTPSHAERRTPATPPLRTCLVCRGVRPQAALLRFVRTAEGVVEPDPDRRRGGRGAYVCRVERCLSGAVRRGRWAQAFRAPAALSPATAERLRTLVHTDDGVGPAPSARGPAAVVSVKGGC
jgi:predicted RNA-binding protein YlxR (DUF448 family)